MVVMTATLHVVIAIELQVPFSVCVLATVAAVAAAVVVAIGAGNSVLASSTNSSKTTLAPSRPTYSVRNFANNF